MIVDVRHCQLVHANFHYLKKGTDLSTLNRYTPVNLTKIQVYISKR